MTEATPSPIPEPDTPAPGLPEPVAENSSPQTAEVNEEAGPSNAERLHGLFSAALHDVLVGILDRLDKAGL